MTVVADNKKRVTIRLAKPGDRFDVQTAGGGKIRAHEARAFPRSSREGPNRKAWSVFSRGA